MQESESQPVAALSAPAGRSRIVAWVLGGVIAGEVALTAGILLFFIVAASISCASPASDRFAHSTTGRLVCAGFAALILAGIVVALGRLAARHASIPQGARLATAVIPTIVLVYYAFETRSVVETTISAVPLLAVLAAMPFWHGMTDRDGQSRRLVEPRHRADRAR